MQPPTTIVRGTVVTMNPQRQIIGAGAVAIEGTTISRVGRLDEVCEAFPNARVSGTASDLVVPGYINGHQHLTGDRLIQSSIPDDLAPGEAIFRWVLPIHGEHTGDDDELAATLTLAESLTNGITTTFEAGTVAHPQRVAAAAERVGARATLGTWGWDVDDGPFAGSVDEVIGRQQALLDMELGPLTSAWVSLIGHDLMSDELVVAAVELARGRGTQLTFHLSPTTSDNTSYIERTGRRAIPHLDSLGVIGPELVIAHGVHIDGVDIEILQDRGASVVSCPWAYLRLGQGVSRDFRHLQLWQNDVGLGLGCDSENAGDMVDGLRTAALFAGLAKDCSVDPTAFGAHEAFELLTIKGAQALGIGDQVGSIEVGKQADIVVHDRSRLEWIPTSPDPVLQLVWGSDGRSVRNVWVAGAQVVSDGQLTQVDISAFAAHAAAAADALRQRSGVPAVARWPVEG